MNKEINVKTSYVPTHRIQLIQELLYLLRQREGVFQIKASDLSGKGYIADKLFSHLKGHEEVFKLNFSETQNFFTAISKALNIKITELDYLSETLKSLLKKGKKLILFIKHPENLNTEDLDKIETLFQEIPVLRVVFLSSNKFTKTLKKHPLGGRVIWVKKLHNFSVFQSMKYINSILDKNFEKDFPFISKFMIAFTANGKPGIINTVIKRVYEKAIHKIMNRRTLQCIFIERHLTAPFFPLKWGIITGLLVLFLTTYGVTMPYLKDLRIEQEQRIKSFLEADIKEKITEQIEKEEQTK